MATHAKLIQGTPYGKAMRHGGMTTPLAQDKAVLSGVVDECWPRDIQTGIPYSLKKTPRFPIAAPPCIERMCYATFNYRAGYTAANHIYAKETVIAAFPEYTPSPFLPTPLRPSLWVVLTGPLPSEDRLAKALDLVEAWHQSKLGKYYQAGKCFASNVMFKGEEEVCEVTPHSEAQRNTVVSMPLAGTDVSPTLHGLVGVLKQQKKRPGGIIKHNTNAVKNLAATQTVPGVNVDEGSSPEPPSKKAKQPAKPAAGVPARGRDGDGAKAGGGAFGSRAGSHAAVAAASTTRELHARRRGGPDQHRI
eukprot:jgi/Tetstr1/448540/TSEL_035800.t1